MLMHACVAACSHACLLVPHLVLLDCADSKAGQVVLPFLVEAGHLCGLTAQQLAAGLLAAVHNALDHLESAEQRRDTWQANA